MHKVQCTIYTDIVSGWGEDYKYAEYSKADGRWKLTESGETGRKAIQKTSCQKKTKKNTELPEDEIISRCAAGADTVEAN